MVMVGDLQGQAIHHPIVVKCINNLIRSFYCHYYDDLFTAPSSQDDRRGGGCLIQLAPHLGT